MTKFVFDLDGTITKKETLPLISKHFEIQEAISRLTEETVRGNIPFVESFIRRVHILGKLPVDQVANLLSGIAVYTHVVNFISQYKENCVIATGNLSCWIDKLAQRIGCCCYCSSGIVKDNRVVRLATILRKENIVERYKSEGELVVFIGDGNNDVEAMRIADVSIASGLTHMPAQGVLSTADYLVFNEEALCRQLNQLL